VRRLRSLRLRAVLVVAAVACGPLLIVAVSDSVERGASRRMERNLVAGLDAIEADPQAFARVAGDRGIWVRLLDGDAVLEHDGETPSWTIRLRDRWLRPDGAPSLTEFDAGRPEATARRVVRAAMEGRSQAACLPSDGGRLVVCEAARPLPGGVIAYVSESSRRPIRAVYDLRYHLGKLTLATLPVALLLAWWLGRRMVRPLELLQAQARAQVAAARPGLKLDRGDEFGDLADALNALLGALDERKQANQAFVADLVHEFKNPVAAIRAASEMLEGGAPTEERTERIARVLGDSTRRLDDLVTRFLELARAEAGLPDEAREPVDVGALARLVDADATVEGDCVVVGVAASLESVVRNLVDNARSFANPVAPEVSVGVVRRGSVVCLTVRDNGPGIDAADRPRVFDRFFTKRRTGKGTGLGLALVRAVAEAHGGGASVRNDGGAVFEVTLRA